MSQPKIIQTIRQIPTATNVKEPKQLICTVIFYQGTSDFKNGKNVLPNKAKLAFLYWSNSFVNINFKVINSTLLLRHNKLELISSRIYIL